MVTDYSEVNIIVFIIAIFLSTNVSNFVHDFSDCFYIIDGVNIFHYTCDSFKSHARVDVRMWKRMVFTMNVFIKLCENKVPNFEESVTVAARFAIRAAATEFFTFIIVNFRVRTRRTYFKFPEVIFFSKFYNSFSRNTDFIMPNSICFIVFFIYRNPKSFLRQFHNFRQKLPCPMYCFCFKIVSKAEVSKHFKECKVAKRLSDIIYIACSYAFLRCSHSLCRRSFFACKILFKRCHSCTD